MPAAFKITDEDFKYVERLLLPSGSTFDEERRAFIENFNTLDLQAVPGSGKTTALLAKLLILDRKLPASDGAGVLVISHTNAAVDEIKSKISKHCPNIFSYPNFVGTIQGFVDHFLAIPFFSNLYKKKPHRIDHEIYNEAIDNFYQSLPYSKAKAWLDAKKPDPLSFLRNLRFDDEYNLVAGIGGEIALKSNPPSPTYKTFRSMKLIFFKRGILHYDDAYFLANLFIKLYPSIKQLLLKRFGFIFVDEMQDMDKHQYDILEKLFYADNNISCYQRIGDKNQSIYSFDVKIDEIWVDRKTVLTLSNSHRLSKPIANIVNSFAIFRNEGFVVNGLNNCSIKPHLLIYDTQSIRNVLPSFSSLLKGFIQSNKIPNSNLNVKAIAWNSTWSDNADKDNPEKVRLEDYCSHFEKKRHKPPIDHECLEAYFINFDFSKVVLKNAHNAITNAILKLLRIEDVLDAATQRYYTKKNLFKHLRDSNKSIYETLKFLNYKWCLLLIEGKLEQLLIEIREFVPFLLEIFDKKIDKSINFLMQRAAKTDGAQPQDKALSNIVNYHEFDIELTTVHSVKGKTLTCVLYLESYYHSDGRGAQSKSYESQRLCHQFGGKYLSGDEGLRVKQSAKIVYVGFSRPTHFLCVAIHKDRFHDYLETLDLSQWDVINCN